ncbi:hypothetical protein Mboo_2335 [Methanoregula boonei 6A8]|jgi:flavodoxin I|uniref:Flavodoxin-like domain-containing protein n=1 Tax=Methanoregula boonei (strain DSM 21154 / JCM 14090 / 6A8) TaxID=456442 RepID=A7IAT8_METB6|nr:hypothetical protein [Methanoregula boonei]ABS56849.1 hypothetical protein Mboo_2335 [Methanoregula boonei 6A8]
METVAVLVDSRAGRTRSAAVAIAEVSGVSVGDIKKPLPDAEILFLGSGMYGTGPGDYMNRLLEEGTFTGRKVALFATATYPRDGEKMLGNMAETLEKKGATIVGNTGSVRGKLIISRYLRLHPEDLEEFRNWAREIVGN